MVPEDKNHMSAHSGLFWWESPFPPNHLHLSSFQTPKLLPSSLQWLQNFPLEPSPRSPEWSRLAIQHYKASWFPTGRTKYFASMNQECKFEQQGFCWSLQISAPKHGKQQNIQGSVQQPLWIRAGREYAAKWETALLFSLSNTKGRLLCT